MKPPNPRLSRSEIAMMKLDDKFADDNKDVVMSVPFDVGEATIPRQSDSPPVDC